MDDSQQKKDPPIPQSPPQTQKEESEYIQLAKDYLRDKAEREASGKGKTSQRVFAEKHGINLGRFQYRVAQIESAMKKGVITNVTEASVDVITGPRGRPQKLGKEEEEELARLVGMASKLDRSIADEQLAAFLQAYKPSEFSEPPSKTWFKKFRDRNVDGIEAGKNFADSKLAGPSHNEEAKFAPPAGEEARPDVPIPPAAIPIEMGQGGIGQGGIGQGVLGQANKQETEHFFKVNAAMIFTLLSPAPKLKRKRRKSTARDEVGKQSEMGEDGPSAAKKSHVVLPSAPTLEKDGGERK